MTEWHEEDALWGDLAPAIFTPDRVSGATREVDQISALISLSPASHVLDLACGTGRHALAFATLGHRVTGVDRTVAYLEIAAERAAESAAIEWIKADMRDFVREREFDLVVNLLTSFGYFEERADDRRVVENVYASLKPGGCFVIDLMGKEVLARIFSPKDWQELPGDTVLLEQRTVAQDWSVVDARWIILHPPARHEHCYRLRLFSARELADLLEEAGFVEVKAYGSLSGAPYDHEAQRLVMVARKR